MSYSLRRIKEGSGFVGVDYVRVTPLGTAGLVQETLLATSAAELASNAKKKTETGLHLPTALQQHILAGVNPATERVGEDIADLNLEQLVTSGVALWTEILSGDTPARVATELVERRMPADHVRDSGLIVLDPSLADSPDAGAFLGYEAHPDEIEAIGRVSQHLAQLSFRGEEPVPGNFL